MDRMQDGFKDAEREHNDSFEKHYNKDLDLEEGNNPTNPNSIILNVMQIKCQSLFMN